MVDNFEDDNPMSDSSIEILRDPKLLERILNETHKTFYGEDDSIMALIVSISTRLVINSNPESRNIVLSEESGAGKDRLVKSLCEILLQEEVNYFHRSKLTPQVFTYWHANESKWTWNNKVIHIEDPSPELINCQGFKTMASGEKKSTIVKEQKAEDIQIKGKPNLIITSYTSTTDAEGIRRYPFIHLNTSNELTKQVMMGKAQLYAKKTRICKDEELRMALTYLSPYRVVIPYADELVRYIPKVLISRTYFGRLLDYIASSTVLHQFQREMDDDGFLIANQSDYDLGRIAFIKTVSNPTMKPLNRKQQQLLSTIMSYSKPISVSEISDVLPYPKRWIYRNIDTLKSYGLIEQETKPNPLANYREVKYYRLCHGIDTVLSLPQSKTIWRNQVSIVTNDSIDIIKRVDDNRVSKGKPRLYLKYYDDSVSLSHFRDNTDNTDISKEKDECHNPAQACHKRDGWDDMLDQLGVNYKRKSL
jgi:hypothetical protein